MILKRETSDTAEWGNYVVTEVAESTRDKCFRLISSHEEIQIPFNDNSQNNHHVSGEPAKQDTD